MLVFIGVYLFVLLLVGVVCQRRVRHVEDYYLAGRGVTLFLAVPTIVATWFGAGSIMGVSASVYAQGMGAVLPDPFGCALALIICALFFAGRLYKARLLTINEILNRAYGSTVERLCAVATIPFYIGTVAAQLVAIGLLLHTFSGFALSTCIMIAGFTVGIYTTLGGLWAVVMTDFIQFLFVVAGLIALLFPIFTVTEYLALSMQGLLDGLADLAPAKHPQHGYLTYVGMLTMTGLGALMGQDLMQRIFACKDAKTAKISLWISAAIYLMLGLGVILLGFYCRLVVSPASSQNVILTLVDQTASPLVLLLFVLGIFSATMSTADSYLLAGSAVVCRSLFQLPDRAPLRIARLSSVVLCLMAALLALVKQDIYALMVHSGAFLFVALFVPVTFALYIKNPPRIAGWISLLAGFTSWASYILCHRQEWTTDLDSLAYAADLVGASFALGSYLVTLAVASQQQSALETI